MAEQAAKVTVTGTPQNPVFNFDIPVGAKGERGVEGPMGPVGPLPQPVVGEVITTPNPADDIWMADIVRNSPSVSAAFKEIFPTSMQGLKGDKGGWDNGTSLNSLDLNTITTPGIYHQWNTNLGNKTLNYPLNGVAGTLHVSRWSGSEGAVLQEFIVLGSGGVETAAQRPRVLAHRYFGNKWSDWSIVAPQRVDNTAGRAIYTWDDTANREQLIYGDTGWRNLDSLLTNGWKTGGIALQIRRVGAIVMMNGAIDGTAFVVDQFVDLGEYMAGFVPATAAIMAPVISSDYSTTRELMRQNNLFYIRSATKATWRINAQWVTNAAWPTSLPGVANGSIPNL